MLAKGVNRRFLVGIVPTSDLLASKGLDLRPGRSAEPAPPHQFSLKRRPAKETFQAFSTSYGVRGELRRVRRRGV